MPANPTGKRTFLPVFGDKIKKKIKGRIISKRPLLKNIVQASAIGNYDSFFLNHCKTALRTTSPKPEPITINTAYRKPKKMA